MITNTLAPSCTLFHLHRKDNGRFILLGYSLDLTGREYQILNYIFESYPTPLRPDEIVAAISGLTSNSLAVFINLINKKAIAIGGRKLVISKHKVGYILNEYM